MHNSINTNAYREIDILKKADYIFNYACQFKVDEEYFQYTKDKIATVDNLIFEQINDQISKQAIIQIENTNKAKLGTIIDCILDLEFCRKDSDESKKKMEDYDCDNQHFDQLNYGTKIDLK